MKKSILFLCTGNSCRSQMAEGYAKKFWGDQYNIYSAGIKKHGLNSHAVQVMQEDGVDITSQTSNTTDELPTQTIDFVFTVCSDAHETCPLFPGGKVQHIGFDDPPRLTVIESDEEKKLAVYRRVRDEIKEFSQNLKQYLE